MSVFCSSLHAERLSGYGPKTGEKKNACQSENGIRKEDSKETLGGKGAVRSYSLPIGAVPGLANILAEDGGPSPHPFPPMAEPQCLSAFHHCDKYSRETTEEDRFIWLMVSGCQSVWLALLLWAHERQNIMAESCGAELFTRCQLEGEKVEGRKEGKDMGGRKGGRVRNET